MAPREIIVAAAIGTRLIEVRHEMPRGVWASRYLLTRPGASGPNRFATLRRARAAFQAQIAGSQCGFPTGTQDA